MTTYRILYDITQDAYNWFMAITQWDQAHKIKNDDFQKIAKNIRQNNLNFSDAKKLLIPFIRRHNKSASMSVEEFEKIATMQLAEKFQPAITKLEQVTKHPLAIQDCAKNRAKEISKIDKNAQAPNEDLLFLITTFPNMPVYYAEGVIYMYTHIDNELWGMPLDGILHELMHFQTNKYYRENPDSPVSKLSNKEYYILKESLTALLDEGWKPLITLPDCSYPEFQPLRDKLVAYHKKVQDFDLLMAYGTEEVKKFANKKQSTSV